MSYPVILFDFDGVLCKDRFYNTLVHSHPHVYNFIQTKVFGGISDIPHLWMKNKMSVNDLNKFISDQTGIDLQELNVHFDESIRKMKLDQSLIYCANKLKKNGYKIAMVTNNMDVFNDITIPLHGLNDIFPVIVNSCDYGLLKHEENGKLFDIAMEMLGENDFRRVVLIDDSYKARTAFEGKGGSTFAYTDFDLFEKWFGENYNL